jgi:ketosteroid isomerase-like protein
MNSRNTRIHYNWFGSIAGIAVVTCALAATPGCGPGDRAMHTFDHQRVESDVMTAIRAFEDAERDCAAERMIAFLDPQFTMLHDGQRCGYDEIVRQMRESMPTLKDYKPRFDDVRVIAIAPDAALTSMTFHDEFTGEGGETIRLRGPTTLLWRKRPEGWLIVYADADHYPAEAAREDK